MASTETKHRFTLRAARVSSGRSAKEAAEYAGISVKKLYEYEKNAENITIEIAYKLLHLYQYPFDAIQFVEKAI